MLQLQPLLSSLLALTTVLAAHASSQAEEGAATSALFLALEGTWDVAIEMGGAPPGAGQTKVIPGPGGKSVLLDFETTSGPMAGFALHQIVTWNRDESELTLVWVDSFNAGATTVQGRREADSFVFDYDSSGPSGLGRRRSVYRIEGPNRFVAESFSSPDGEAFERVMTLSYSRQDDTDAEP